jgi:hypothetical protein
VALRLPSGIEVFNNSSLNDEVLVIFNTCVVWFVHPVDITPVADFSFRSVKSKSKIKRE